MDKTIAHYGFWSGFIAFLSALAFVVVQVLQVLGLLKFPYDEIFIYSTSLCIVIPFVLEILAIHYVTANEKKFWTHGALLFSVMYAIFVISNYVVQLATVIPMKIRGEGDKIRILEQTPHSLFWDFDALGYIFMGLSMLMAVPAFEKQGFQRWVRISLLANALVTPLIAFVYFYPVFSVALLFLGFPWGITAPWAMLMLALMLRKKATLN